MTNTNYESLQMIMEDFLLESIKIKNELHDNLMKIKEIDIIIKAINESKESNFDIFSPRKIENPYKEKMKAHIKEKTNLEYSNQNIYSKINQLENKISVIQEILLTKDSLPEHNNRKIKLKSKESNNSSWMNLYIIDIQEKERQRIARDLHDFSLQNLTHLIHTLKLSSLFMDQDLIRAKLELVTAEKNLKSIIEDIRNTIYDLRPMSFENLGFRGAVEELISKFNTNSSIFIDLEMEELRIDDENLFTLYSIIRECLSNAVNHSMGKEIKIKIYSRETNCIIEISDNGKGFNVNEVMNQEGRHFGLLILVERIELLKGNIQIESEENKGTFICIQIPM